MKVSYNEKNQFLKPFFQDLQEVLNLSKRYLVSRKTLKAVGQKWQSRT